MGYAKVLRNLLGYIWQNPSNEGQKLYRTALAVGWQVYKRSVGLPIIVRLDNGREYIAQPESGNAVGAIYTRVYEPEYVLFLRKHISTTPLGFSVDVGAHTGLFTLWISDLVEGGYCFEPARDTYQLLRRNIGLNDLHKSFHTFNAAASEKTGILWLAVNSRYSGTNHVVDSADKGYEVEVKTIDSVVADESRDLTFLKIDTEGHDLAVLTGARDLLARSPHAIALVENSNAAGIRAAFNAAKWRVFAIDKKGNILSSFADIERAYNVLACGPDHPLYPSLPALSAADATTPA